VSNYLNGFYFEPAAPPPPLTTDEINALLARIEAGKKRIACASDVYERVRDAVYGAGYGICFKVMECSWMDDGQVVVMPSEAEWEAETQAAGLRMMDEMITRCEQERRDAAAVDSYRRWYGAAVYQPPPFSPIITGI
jgi:hypothetical protein